MCINTSNNRGLLGNAGYIEVIVSAGAKFKALLVEKINMGQSLIHLLNLLEAEFQGAWDLRVIPVFPSKTERALDLPQDYDPEQADVHRLSGVKVVSKTREYFFPEEWFFEPGRVLINRLIDEIRESDQG